jgi:hydroxyethylthiazole kinase-like uncharacterized protein yjeF
MNVQMWDEAKSARHLKPAFPSDNKYTRGVVTFITGSKKYPGAALLTTQAALACGVGMVRYLGPRSVKKLVLLNTPQVVVTKGRTDAFVLGSGVPTNRAWLTEQKMKSALGEKLPTVLDAGAILLAPYGHELTVITPHYGELKNLLSVNGSTVTTSEIQQDPAKWAKLTADKFKLTVLLKGNTTYVANPQRVIKLPPAPPQLATAGTGDVLAGILGALLALNKDSVDKETLPNIAATASLVHALATDLIGQISGGVSLNLTDLIKKLPTAIAKLQSVI